MINKKVCFSYSQTIYEVETGTKGNEITITFSNISEIETTENIVVDLIKSPSSLIFRNKKQIIEKIEANKKADVSFSFDANFCSHSGKKYHRIYDKFRQWNINKQIFPNKIYLAERICIGTELFKSI